ncbi:hypothetical protein [Cellulomonas sp.]|uniref:hypothetical protein n=1 Tax=Cellulomonas sp. TaxID=40001 RepID=UPI0028123D95|nr:hypothetical protein [Cellulomonas sp.]
MVSSAQGRARREARLDGAAIAERTRVAAGPDGRPSVGDVATWNTFPFERDGLRVRSLADPVVPEPPRSGEDPTACRACAAPDAAYAWTDDRWRLKAPERVQLPGFVLEPRVHVDLGDLDEDGAGALGRMVVRVERALAAVPGVGRVHVHRWGDGAAHLHVFFLARPEGLLQLRGLTMPVWSSHLPALPDDEWHAIVAAVVAGLGAGGAATSA